MQNRLGMLLVAFFVALSAPAYAKQKATKTTVHFVSVDDAVYSVPLEKAQSLVGCSLPRIGSDEKKEGRPLSWKRTWDTVIANSPRGECNMDYLTFRVYYESTAVLTGTHAVCKTREVRRGYIVKCDNPDHRVVVWGSELEADVKKKLCPAN